jgi:serine protease
VRRYDSDIIAGMLWAAGFEVPGVPTNPTPARVINMSLGGNGACDSSNASARVYIEAIAQITAAGTVVVASAGNSAGHAVSLPADCAGVIGVAGLRHIGTKVGFSDLGPEIAISAPGELHQHLARHRVPVLILTTTNSGIKAGLECERLDEPTASTTPPSAPASGTAVAGTVALMLSV